MSSIEKIKQNRLRLLADKQGTRKHRQEETYMDQQKQIDSMITQISNAIPNRLEFEKMFTAVLDSCFYSKPSEAKIQFLELMRAIHPDVLVSAVSDFQIHLVQTRNRKNRRTKPEIKIFWNYIKVEQRKSFQAEKVTPKNIKEVLGFED
jgi:hypothetical protein